MDSSIQISHGKLQFDVSSNQSHISDDQLQILHDDEFEDDEFEFTFAPIKPHGFFISADDNGEIRPIFPLFNTDLIDSNQTLVEQRDLQSSPETEHPDDVPAGEYCVWTGTSAVEASPTEMCKKCNSTGFSKLWRFRDLLHRSNSDGKDKFVFLQLTNTKSKKTVTEVVTEKLNGGERNNGSASRVKGQTALTAHFERNRAIKEGNKRRSYLPYRQDLVGFFTHAHSLSRNVHPY